MLFRGNAEATIRRNLVQRGYIKGIIGLPPNLFYGTGIPACIIVLDKEGANARKGIFMIDASKSFIKDGNKNRLREQDIHKIVDTFAKQGDVPRYARLVPVTEVSDQKNDYNLNLPRYIDSSEPEDIQDIEGHLRGGIPNRDVDALERYWEIIPAVRSELFKPLRENYSQLAVAQTEIKQTIFGHREFAAFNEQVNGLVCEWKQANTPKLKDFDKDGRPKVLIETIAEDLLATFRKAPLLDAYDVYQHLMDYWAETMRLLLGGIPILVFKAAAPLKVAVAYRSETGSSVRATFDLNLPHRVSMIDMSFRARFAQAATRKSSLLIFGEL